MQIGTASGMAFLQYINMLFGWLPLPFQALAAGIIVIFMAVTLLRIVGLVLDALPFL